MSARPRLSSVAVTVMALAGLLTFAGCGGHGSHERNDPPAPDPVVVTTTTATAVAQPRLAPVLATIRPRVAIDLAAQITGPIEALPVDIGDRVEQGELLVRISETEIRARLLQAQAQLREAENALDREQSLFAQNASSASELDRARAAFEIAEGMVEEAETILSYTRIEAPFSGFITQKHAEAGDLATPGRPLLTLENPAEWRAEAEVPEALIDYVEAGAEVRVRTDNPPLAMTGVVREVSPAADPVARTFLAKIDIPAQSGLRSGQFARVFFPAGKVTPLLVPAAAISAFGQIERLFVVTDATAHLRIVKTGAAHGNQVEIIAGLEPGSEIVHTAEAPLRDGMPVILRD